MNGPHIQTFVNTSVYPTFQLLNWGQDNINLYFDCYYNGTNLLSSSTTSNFQIAKYLNKISFNYKNGGTLGQAITMSEAMNISNAGVITTTGAITANGGISTTTATASGLITANAGVSTTTLTASGLITANAGITYTGTLSSASASSNGAKIAIQGTTDGTDAKGILMWDVTDSNWGIYMATSGAGKSSSGGSAPTALNNDFTSHAIRFRVNNTSNNGFIWENSSNSCKISLRADNGQLVVPLNVYVTSDKRLKTDIKECIGLEFINKLNPVCFCMIENNTPLRMGMIAQELDYILKELNMPDFAGLSKNPIMLPYEKQRAECELKGECINPQDVKMVDTGDYSYTIAYPEFIAPLIKAVQELSER